MKISFNQFCISLFAFQSKSIGQGITAGSLFSGTYKLIIANPQETISFIGRPSLERIQLKLHNACKYILLSHP